jgi:hypothetical protein
LGDVCLKWEILFRVVLLNYSEERLPSEVVVVRYYMNVEWTGALRSHVGCRQLCRNSMCLRL